MLVVCWACRDELLIEMHANWKERIDTGAFGTLAFEPEDHWGAIEKFEHVMSAARAQEKLRHWPPFNELTADIRLSQNIPLCPT